MKISTMLSLGFLLGAVYLPEVYAQQVNGTPGSPSATTTIDVLKGAWVRPDGGYTIAISKVDSNGQLEAMYFNPNQLSFAKAQATQDGLTVRASFELQAGGYNGSTYELTYDAANDRLKGIYFQAVAKQKFDVFFVRK